MTTLFDLVIECGNHHSIIKPWSKPKFQFLLLGRLFPRCYHHW